MTTDQAHATYPWADEVRAVRHRVEAIRGAHGLWADTGTCRGCPPGTPHLLCPELREADAVMIRAGLEDPPGERR